MTQLRYCGICQEQTTQQEYCQSCSERIAKARHSIEAVLQRKGKRPHDKQ